MHIPARFIEHPIETVLAGALLLLLLLGSAEQQGGSVQTTAPHAIGQQKL